MGQIQGSASDIVLKQDIVDLVYPVGSYYWSSISTNPAIVFGGGTWVQVKDVFLYAVGDTAPTNVADYVGGEKEHTLTVDEMPRHNHEPHFQGMGGNIYLNGTSDPNGGNIGISGYLSQPSDSKLFTNDTGNSQPFNNLPPFITAFCWRRVA